MTFLFRFFAALLLLIVARSVLARFFKPRQASKPASRPPRVAPSDQMIKDPFCGTYVASSLALVQRIGGQEYHFCSAACRDGYLLKSSDSSEQVASSGARS